MRKIYDVRCQECDTKEEVFAELDATHRCDCGGEMKRLVGAVRSALDPISGDFPGATLAWAREHERKALIDTSEQG